LRKVQGEIAVVEAVVAVILGGWWARSGCAGGSKIEMLWFYTSSIAYLRREDGQVASGDVGLMSVVYLINPIPCAESTVDYLPMQVSHHLYSSLQAP
jgi:hypothetical protein